jgi:uncharacterized protein YhjY with autotransporter beta-barrel domain
MSKWETEENNNREGINSEKNDREKWKDSLIKSNSKSYTEQKETNKKAEERQRKGETEEKKNRGDYRKKDTLCKEN